MTWFQVKDISATTDYCSLKAENFSPSSLDGLDIFHTNLSVSDVGPLPVFRATLSLVRNGHLLCVSVHHSTTDITGFGALLKIWASYCRTGSSRYIQFANNWLDRGRLSNTPTDASPRCPEFLHTLNIPKTREDPASIKFADMESSILIFQRERLKDLKAEVIGRLPRGMSWVSTGDILTAVLWSAIVFVELQDDANLARNTAFLEKGEHAIRIPVNFRSRYTPPLPRDCLGAAFGISLATARESDLKHIAAGAENVLFLSSLARVAAAVRGAVNLVEGGNMRSVVGYLAAQKDLTNIQLGPHNSIHSIVSWADEGIYDLDWGKIGYCEAVRLPRLKNKRYPIVLPRHTNGDVEVFVRLPKKQMENLKNQWVMRPV